MKRRSVARGGHPTLRALSAGLALACATAACQKKEPPKPEPPPAPAAATAQAKPAPKPKPAVKALEWKDPPEWKRVKPSSSMRRASYEIPPAKGDKEPGELNVFVLGGDVESNIQRWLDEFSGYDAKTIVRADRTVGDLPQAVVELPKGTFSGGMATTKASENYGLLGAIVVMPSGSKYFFKMTGPSATVKAARAPFYAMLDSMKIEGSEPSAAAPAATAPGAAPASATSGAQPAPAAKQESGNAAAAPKPSTSTEPGAAPSGGQAAPAKPTAGQAAPAK